MALLAPGRPDLETRPNAPRIRPPVTRNAPPTWNAPHTECPPHRTLLVGWERGAGQSRAERVRREVRSRAGWDGVELHRRMRRARIHPPSNLATRHTVIPLRRPIPRRAPLGASYSDHGTNFTATSQENNNCNNRTQATAMNISCCNTITKATATKREQKKANAKGGQHQKKD